MSLLQRDFGDEAQGFAEKLLAGADEGVEVSSDWGSGARWSRMRA